MAEKEDPDKYLYSGDGDGFEMHRKFSLSRIDRFRKNVIIFGIDNSCSAHAVNKIKVS